jgi:hypothetical protein
MSTYRMNLNSRRRFARFATIIMLLAAGVASSRAQTPPYAEFQYSTLTASSNTITATRLPVVTSTGTSYMNVVLQFDVATDGTLTLAPGYPQVVPSPAQIISRFLAGTYVGPSGSGMQITVSGPGVTSGGATEWSIAASGGDSCSTPATATFDVFGGAMTQNPLYTRLKAANITPHIYASYGGWGTTGTQSCDAGSDWQTGTLIGLSQTGSALAIVSFTVNGKDQNQPANTITYSNTNP